MGEEGVERRLTTILAVDVVGYSRLMAMDEAGTLARLKAFHADIVGPKAARHRGRVVKLIGDGILMEFSSVVDAISFAVDVQRAVAMQNAGIPTDRQIAYRIGINIGDVIVDGEDIYGDGVNVAARLEALAEPGGICVSRTVYDHVKGKVEVGFQDLGAQQVKNIPEPVEVFRVLKDAPDALVPDQRAPAAPARHSVRWAAAGGIIAALLAAAGLALWQRPWEPRKEPASEARMAFPLPDKPSIAVLPFDDLSESASQEYFADGMTEDLITDLSKISGLFVIARNSSFAYKGTPVTIRQVAEDLGVRYVLEGSVRRVGDQLRVNAQLIDATTGGHIWADRFDGDVADIFAVQDQFVLKIVNALELKLSDTERSEITGSDTFKIEAKEAFQRGWELYSRFNEQDNARSVSHFEKAIELDPEYDRAYGALALVYLRGSIFRWDQALGQQEAHLRRVVVPQYLEEASRHDSALVHVVKAMQHLFYRHQTEPEGTNRGTDDARREAGLAIALQPSDPEAHIMMAWALTAAGKPEEGLNFVRAAMRLNPNYPSHYVFFNAAAHYGMGDLEQAANILRAGLDRDPRATELAPMAASVYAHLGLRQEALAAFMIWRPSNDPAERLNAIAHYAFPINWVNEHQGLNKRLLDGLRLAALPVGVTVASLVGDLDRQEPSEQVNTIRALGWFGPAAAPAIPELTKALGSARRAVRREAAIALGEIGPDAKAAVPALTAILDEPIVGYHAAEALKKIDGR